MKNTLLTVATLAWLIPISSPAKSSQVTISDTDFKVAVARLAVNEYSINGDKRGEILAKTLQSLDKVTDAGEPLNEMVFVQKTSELLNDNSLSKREILTHLFDNSISHRTQIIEKKEHVFTPNKVHKDKKGHVVISIGDLIEPNCHINILNSKTITIDLSMSQGGSLDCAEKVAKELLSVTSFNYTLWSNNGEEVRTIKGESTNKYHQKFVKTGVKTASSSELIAWLLIEDGYTLIGEDSYGKNSVQAYYHSPSIQYKVNFGEFRTRNCNTNGCKLRPDSQ